MIFGEVSIKEARGCILAHSVRLPDGRLNKGLRIGDAEIAQLRDANLTSVVAASLEPGDVHEDEAARRVADFVRGDHVETRDPFTGRVNFSASADGVFVADARKIAHANHIDEGITIATLPPYSRVRATQLIATVKIIPIAVSDESLSNLEALAPTDRLRLDVYPFQPKRIGLILSRLPGDADKVLAKRREAMATRVNSLSGCLVHISECAHRVDMMTAELHLAQEKNCDIIMVFGASAIIDREDVIPASLVASGGTIVQLGMPVDPGNLLLLGSLEGAPVIGVPSCAASIKINGFDWILERLFADLPVGRDEIVAMAAGGLLSEIPSRPMPREFR